MDEKRNEMIHKEIRRKENDIFELKKKLLDEQIKAGEIYICKDCNGFAHVLGDKKEPWVKKKLCWNCYATNVLGYESSY